MRCFARSGDEGWLATRGALVGPSREACNRALSGGRLAEDDGSLPKPLKRETEEPERAASPRFRVG